MFSGHGYINGHDIKSDSVNPSITALECEAVSKSCNITVGHTSFYTIFFLLMMNAMWNCWMRKKSSLDYVPNVVLDCNNSILLTCTIFAAQ